MVADVEVKGWRNGLLILLPPEGAWEQIVERVHARLDEAKARSFWRGAQTTFDCGLRAVTQPELEALLDRVKLGFGLVPVAIVAADAATREAGEKLALVSYAEMPVIKKAPRPEFSRPAGAATAEPAAAAAGSAASGANNALYVPGTVRSGQRIVHDGHLVILGDVNAGAEVLAEGDIVIFGSLRGLAHAGCTGDETARIVAVSLHPPQLRIAGKIARSPEGSAVAAAGKGGGSAAARTPEVARIEDGEIQVSPL